jgi:hypothetical protein
MNLLLWGITIGTIGKLVLGIAVLRVHVYILREHKIDAVVLSALKREQIVTVFGLGLIVFGYLLEILFYNNASGLLTCTGEECTALIRSAFSN